MRLIATTVIDTIALPERILWLAFGLGSVFGAVAQRSRFCPMGAIADIVNMRDWQRMRMWLLAIAVAVLGSAALHSSGRIDLARSIYRSAGFPWLAHAIGGASFGFGMVLASGCAARTLVRIGGGSLKAMVVLLIVGLFAEMTMRGALAGLRINLSERWSAPFAAGHDLPALLIALGLPADLALAGCALAIGSALLAFVFLPRQRLAPGSALAGLCVGLSVVGGWYVSGALGYLAEDPETLQEAFVATNSGRMESLSFVAPQAYLLELLMLWSDSNRHLSFAVASLLGVLAGSLLSAVGSGSFRWEGFRDLEDTANHIVGAALMGFGGVLGLGCTIGQGISGVSTLALGSFVTLAAIIGGALLALHYQYRRAQSAR